MSSLVSSAWWCQHAVSPSMLPLRMPQVLFREDKGTRVRLAISRHSVRQGEGRMPVALSPCGPVHPKHQVSAPTLAVGPVFPLGPSSLPLSPADAQQALGWGRHRSPEPAVGAASPLAFLPHSLPLYFLFFSPAGELKRGMQLVTPPDSRLPVT